MAHLLPEVPRTPCDLCKGSGRVAIYNKGRHMFRAGKIDVKPMPCPQCRGTGKMMLMTK